MIINKVWGTLRKCRFSVGNLGLLFLLIESIIIQILINTKSNKLHIITELYKYISTLKTREKIISKIVTQYAV